MAPPKKKPTSTIVTRSAAAAATPPIAVDEPMDVEVPASSTPPAAEKGATAESATPPRPPPATSPTKCAICLGDLVNSCYTNSCMHQFCFACLLQWSKVKPECPLCKSLFQSIYHNIRNNDDYDEYNVPSPTESMPTLSIHFASHDAFSPNPYRTSATFRRLPFAFGAPHEQYHDHGYSFHRFMSRERARVDRMRDPSYIRILEMGPLTEPRAFDLMNMNAGVGARPPLDNPFYSEEPELFGSFSTAPAPDSRYSSTRGYTRRRRIYDRGQYVQSFNATTIPPGTVFFPSVEYFRTHPGSYSRVSEWLHRELSVLLGLTHTRLEMANVYDTIFTLLFRYDIRSNEFREMLRGILNDRTRHFQHEFYNFVLSGMRIEEYDRLSVYSSPSRSGTTTRNAQASPAVPHSDQPLLVTISDDETNDVSEIDVSSSATVGQDLRTDPRPTVIQNTEIVLSDEEGHDRVVPVTSSTSGDGTSGHSYRSQARAMDEMLVPDHDFTFGDRLPGPSGGDGSHYHNANARTRRHRPRTTIAEDRARRLEEFRFRLEGRREPRAQSFHLSTLSPPPAHSSSSASTNLEFQRPSRSGRTYVPSTSTLEQSAETNDDTWAWLAGRSLGAAAGTSRSFERHRVGPPEVSSREGGWRTIEDVATPGNLSCAPLRFGVGVRISHDQSSSRSRNETPSTSGRRRPSPSHLNVSVEEIPAAVSLPKPSPAGPLKLVPAPPPAEADDSDDVELLGVHAIVKPPPLAVITLSSDEEEDASQRLKTENQTSRNTSVPEAPGSPDLVIDDEFLNWTMERNGRQGFDMFPLVENDEVQPIMDFRQDLPFGSGLQLYPSGAGPSGLLSSLNSAFSSYDASGTSSSKCKKSCKRGTKSKCRSKKSSKTKKRKSTSNPTLSDSDEEERVAKSLVLGSTSKRRKTSKRSKVEPSDKKRSPKVEKSKSKLSREDRKLESINRMIAQMEEREKQREKPGPSRELRKRNFLMALSSSSSSSDDTLVDETQVSSSTPADLSVPLPSGPTSAAASSMPGPSTSYAAQGPSTSKQGLLDFRKMDEKVLQPSRERRWESDDGDDSQQALNLMTVVSDSDSSHSSDCMVPGNIGSGSGSRAFLEHREATDSSLDCLNIDEDEPLFAPVTSTETSDRDYLARLGRRPTQGLEHPRLNVDIPPPESSSPPLPFRRASASFQPSPTRPHTFGQRPRLSSGIFQLYNPHGSSSEEDAGSLLDLRVPPNDAQSAIGSNPTPTTPLQNLGYWSEAHDDWMAGGSD